MIVDMQQGQTPRRGDLVQTTLHDKRGGRTYLVLHARKVKSREHDNRFNVMAAR